MVHVTCVEWLLELQRRENGSMLGGSGLPTLMYCFLMHLSGLYQGGDQRNTEQFILSAPQCYNTKGGWFIETSGSAVDENSWQCPAVTLMPQRRQPCLHRQLWMTFLLQGGGLRMEVNSLTAECHYQQGHEIGGQWVELCREDKHLKQTVAIL